MHTTARRFIVSALAALALATHATTTRAQTFTNVTSNFTEGVRDEPGTLAVGSDGSLWTFDGLQSHVPKLVKFSADGSTRTEIALPANFLTSRPTIALGPDGRLWVSGQGLAQVSLDGTVTSFPTNDPYYGPYTDAHYTFKVINAQDGTNMLFLTGDSQGDLGKVAVNSQTPTYTDLTGIQFQLSSAPYAWRAASAAGTIWVTSQYAPQGLVTLPDLHGTEAPGGGICVGGAGTSSIRQMVGGPDGAVWMTVDVDCGAEGTRHGILRYKNTVFTGYSIGSLVFEEPNSGLRAGDIIVGADGNLWFLAKDPNTWNGRLGRITTSGTITIFDIPNDSGGNDTSYALAAGANGSIYMTRAKTVYPFQNGNYRLTRFDPTGHPALQVTPANNIAATGNKGGPFTPASFNYTLSAASGSVNYAITGVPSWLTASSASGTVTTSGTTVTFTVNASANSLNAGTQNATIAFTNTDSGTGNTTRVASLRVVDGTTSLFSAVLPASRSVQVNSTATAFGTIINAGSNKGVACGLSLGSTIPATFGYQTTDPATNAVTGAPNTPADIPVGGAQSFVFSVTPTAAFAPTDVTITASCANASAAPTSVGLNTLLLSASSTPVPDIVALGATPTHDGILSIQGSTGAGAFAVATVNVGSAATITASADTGSVGLALQLLICQTNPNGSCQQNPAASVTTAIATNATPTFSIFAQANGTVPFDPANNRIFVRFKDGGGVTRGSTSVAVRTQ